MAEKIKLVQGDTLPQIKATITNDDGTATNLTGATPRLKFRAVGSNTVLVTLTGIVTNAAAGEVVFNWNDGDLDREAGDYEGEIEVTFPSGQIQTVYDPLKFKLREDF